MLKAIPTSSTWWQTQIWLLTTKYQISGYKWELNNTNMLKPILRLTQIYTSVSGVYSSVWCAWHDGMSVKAVYWTKFVYHWILHKIRSQVPLSLFDFCRTGIIPVHPSNEQDNDHGNVWKAQTTTNSNVEKNTLNDVP